MKPFVTANLRLESLTPDRITLWLDVADRPVNVFSPQVLQDFDAALDHVAAESACKLLFIASPKQSGFIAGADVHEFATIRTAAAAQELSARGQALFAKLAALPQATVAVIHGPCLGGGLECALACDYRLVVDHPKTQLGLPEIDLGLLPAWGGTQRLPRVVGLESALKIILGRKRLNAREALKWKLADALAESAQDLPVVLAAMAEHALSNGKRPRPGLPLHSWRQKLLESNPLGRGLIFRGAAKMLAARVPDDMPAPAEALKAIRTGIEDGLTAGLQSEQDGIGRLATSPACRNLVTIFLLREQARKLPPASADAPPLQKIAVVGAGTMGAGIAQLAAVNGRAVVVREVNDNALAAGVKKIEDLFAKAVEHRVLSAADAQKKLTALQRTTSWEGFHTADLVIEAAIEDLAAKQQIFAALEQHTRPGAVLATNTSSLQVAQLQDGRTHPARIGGLHFFNPVHKMPLVEVVRGPATDEATVQALVRFAVDMGKMPVVVKDSPGFLVNRILMPYLNHAVVPLCDDWPIDKIDRAVRRFGMPMGPFELLDQVGLDVAAHIEKTMRPTAGPRFAPNPIFNEMAQRGWLGTKAGVGFYRGRKVNRDVYELPSVVAKWTGSYPIKPPIAEFVNGLILLMVNEAAMCLGEGIAANAETIDLAMVFGTGWAPHRGGPLRYADDTGLPAIVEKLTRLQAQFGPRFEPCAELRRRAASNEKFYQLAQPGSGG